MPNTTTTYQLEARSNLAQTLKSQSDAMRDLGSASDVTFKQMTQGMNATTRAAAEMRREVASANQQAKAAGDGIGGLWKQIGLGTTIGNLASKALMELGSAVTDIGGKMVQGASDTEGFTNAFTRMLGSKGAADEFIASLRQFSLKTPFEFEGAAKGAQTLLNLNIAQKEVLPTLHALGDAVAANGGKTDEFNRAMLAYTQVVARGKVAAQEMNQFSQAGIPAWDLLAQAMHKTRAEVMQLSQDGAISAEEFTAAFQQAASTRYAGAMAAQMDTLAGSVSNVSDLIQSLGSSVLGPALKVVEEEINRAVTAIQDPAVQATLSEWGTNLGKVTQAAFQLGGELVDMGKQALDALRPVTDVLGALIGTLPGVKLPSGGNNPVAPVAKSAADLADSTGDAAIKADKYTKQIQDAQDHLESLRRTDQDRNYALDTAIQGERTKLSLLEQQYAIQDRATGVERARQKLQKDTNLAKDLFSGAGQAAAARLKDDQANLQDALTAQSREATKAQINDRIGGLEAQKRAQDRAAQLEQRAAQDSLQAWQRRAAFEKDEATRRAKQAADDKAAMDAQTKAWQAGQTSAETYYKSVYDHSVDSTKQVQDGTKDQGTAIKALNEAVDKLGEALGFPHLAADMKEAKYQLTDMFLFISTHADAAGKEFDHMMRYGIYAGKKIREALGLELTEGDRSYIKQFEADQATLDRGNSLADTAYATAKAKLDAEYGKSMPLGPPSPPPGYVAPPQGTQYGPPGPGTFGVPAGGFAVVTPAGRSYPLAGGRAGGGPVTAGQTYLVGEHSPELFTPGSNGYISPGGGGGEIVVTVKHLCPECLEETVDRRMARVGSRIIGGKMIGAMG